MSASSNPRAPLRLLRTAIALVVVFALGGTVWLVGTSLSNPDVRARKPRWVEGLFDMPFWLPLTATFLFGALLVALVYLRAARRLAAGEDLYAKSFRARKWRELEERLEATKKP